LREIEDPEVARQILEKVNNMNKSTGKRSFIIAAVYALVAYPLHQVIAAAL